jgi:hypothetical protein
MSNRIRTVSSLLFAAFLASMVSTFTTRAAAPANDCLSGPNHQTPPGGHWYYRIDRPNSRRCWFLGDEGQYASQTGSRRPSASPSAPTLPRQTAVAIEPPLADARAELPMVTTPTEPAQPEKIIVPDVSPWERPSPLRVRVLEGVTKVMRNGVIDGQSRTESRTKLLPGATDRESAAELPAEDTTAGPLRRRLARLLIILGLSTIGGCLIFRFSAAVGGRRRDVLSSR